MLKETTSKRRFFIELIKPSHYDDDGYVIQWRKAWIPSNSLSCLFGLARDAAARQVLGPDVEIVVRAWDETNTVVPVKNIIKRMAPEAGLVCLVGVQSNQFPRALDLARRFRAAGLQVAIGGFHVSGCLAMLPELPPDLQEALDLGATLFAGESEGRFDSFLADAYAKRLEPIYNYMSDLPGLENATVPFLPAKLVARYAGSMGTLDAGRGCPFQCSFCTIINVQGRKSRYRSADDIEQIMRQNLAQGVFRFFITDDNFARNRNWEAIFDRIGDIRAEGHNIKLTIQVDTLCHMIPGFVDKAKRAGVRRVFLGLENINPDNLVAAKKKQNRITEYRRMLLAWRAVEVTTYAGYILGFPGDTPERIREDIEIVKRELPIDVLEFFCLTPLPGSEDHKKLALAGVPMEPDMNIYDLEHVCTAHPKMSKAEWEGIYREAWDIYYSWEHIETIMRRMVACNMGPKRMVWHVLQFYGCLRFEKVHALQGGFLRRKVRTERRSSLPIESPFRFYPRRAWEWVATYSQVAVFAARLLLLHQKVRRDPASKTYTDRALTPVIDAETENLAMFDHTEAAKAAVDKARRDAGRRRKPVAA